MATAETSRAARASAWLLGEGRQAADGDALLRGFGETLIGLGVPVDRATVHAPTLHPRYRWRTRVWHPGEPTRESRRPHGIEATPTFHGNPVEHVTRSDAWLDIRLDRDGPKGIPVLGTPGMEPPSSMSKSARRIRASLARSPRPARPTATIPTTSTERPSTASCSASTRRHPARSRHDDTSARRPTTSEQGTIA